MSLKVLYVVKTNYGAKWAFEQAKWLKNQGIEIIAVLPRSDEGVAKEYRDSGIIVEGYNLSLPIKELWKYKSIQKNINFLINKYNPDIIHCHFFTNIVMLRLCLRNSNIPRIFQVPGPLHLENYFFRKVELMTAQSRDYWAGSCQKTCEIYRREGVNNEKIFLCYYGGYGGETIEAYSEGNKLRSQYGIDENTKIIGMISYFYKPKYHLLQFKGLKGHDYFIRAFKDIKRQGKNVKAIIIGGPWGNSSKYMEKIKRKANRLCGDDIIFTGYREDIKEIYKEIDIIVHPSLSENLGGAAESLAAGVPTITTNIGGFPDIVKDGVTGYTVPAKNYRELSKKINLMLDNESKLKKMSLNGKMLVSNLLDIENTGRSVMEMYRKITNEFYK